MPLEKIDALAYSQDRFAARHAGKGVCIRLAVYELAETAPRR